MKYLICCSIFFIISTICTEESNASANYDLSKIKTFTKEELEVLEDALRKQYSRLLSNVQGSAKCEGLQCESCVEFEWSKVSHKICLTAELNPEKIGVFIVLSFDANEIWRQDFNFNTICAGLPPPLSKIGICLEAYNVSVQSLPDEAVICLRTELSLIFPILNVDFNCIKYEKGTGLSFDWSIPYKSNALVNININGGHPIVTFNNPISHTLFLPIIEAINDRRDILGLEMFVFRAPWIDLNSNLRISDKVIAALAG